jgi:glycosidase
MLYLIMPDRFANGNPKNDSDAATKKNTIAIYPAEDTAATRDNKNLDYISSLGAAIWSTPLCEDNDKAYSITPMLNLMFIKLTPLRNKC